jgi:hypothetical protein
MIFDYPSISMVNIFSNGQIYYRRHNPFAATLHLSLSLPLPLSLRYLALSPQLSVDYLNCHVKEKVSLTKCISPNAVLICTGSLYKTTLCS